MQVLKPTVASLGGLEIEHARVNNILDFNLTIAGLDNLGTVVEFLDQVGQASSGASSNLSLPW